MSNNEMPITKYGMLKVYCPSFGENGQIPIKHTGFGEDISPQFMIEGLKEEVRTLAIIMDDLNVPVIGELNHWVIWNLPPKDRIPENFPHGAECSNGARQGVAYGKNCYRGPKQPAFLKQKHQYRFCVYGLDVPLGIPSTCKKKELVKAMTGHILQKGEIIGWYQP